nr:hypothetical protein [Tanacetum cinerariifolium]
MTRTFLKVIRLLLLLMDSLLSGLEDDVEWLMALVMPPRATMTVSSTYEVGGPSTAAEDDVEWLMAPVMPSRATMTVSSTYEVGGPSTAAVEGPSSPLPALGLLVSPIVIKDLSTHLSNLEYRHGLLMRKMEEVSDAEVAESITIGEIHPRVATVGEQVESRVDTHPSGRMAMQGQEVIVGSSKQVQTLQTALHETELQNHQLRTRVTEMESHVGVLMSHILWMEKRLTVLEKRLPRPPPGPQ